MSSSEDPYALHADGTAVDPRAFREAALADAALAEDLKGDARASRVLASGDDAALQELLKEVHQEESRRAERESRAMSERTIDAQRASAPVPRDTAQLYAQLAEAGLQYGPAFRLLRNVHVPEEAMTKATE